MTPEGDELQPEGLSIVAVDDDPDFREYLAGLLSDDGHEVRAVESAAAAVQTVDQAMPDLVLLDMNMGADSGEHLLETLRERWPRLCVIVITGYPSLANMRNTFKRSAFDYLSKPFAPDDLRQVIAQAAAEFGLGQRPQDRLRASLGRQIRVARTERQWTLRDLSDASSVSVSQLSSIERGAHLPSMESLLAIAHALEQAPSRWLETAGF